MPRVPASRDRDVAFMVVLQPETASARPPDRMTGSPGTSPPPRARIRAPRVAVCAAAVLACLAFAATASAVPYVPGKGNAFHGISDTGDVAAFYKFAQQTGAHPAVMQTFHTWGTFPSQAMLRWDNTETRGMISVGTSKGYAEPEVISPAGDRQRRGRQLPAQPQLRDRDLGPAGLHPADGRDERALERLLRLQPQRDLPRRGALARRLSPGMAPLRAHRSRRPGGGRSTRDCTSSACPRSRRPARDPAEAQGRIALGPALEPHAQHPRQPLAGLLARQEVRRLGRHRHLLDRAQLGEPQPPVRGLQAQAVRDRRVRADG